MTGSVFLALDDKTFNAYNGYMNIYIILLLFVPFLISLTGCASHSLQNEEYPAPHNNYTGIIISQHFEDEDVNIQMIRACQIYGGLKQKSIANTGDDFLFQNIITYQCNYIDKDDNELNFKGKSSKRLSGTVARIKCVKLDFKIGTKDFTRCMTELTQ
jgi:hypothetical protein